MVCAMANTFVFSLFFLAKEVADLEEAEEEERNLKFYTDLDALVEW